MVERLRDKGFRLSGEKNRKDTPLRLWPIAATTKQESEQEADRVAEEVMRMPESMSTSFVPSGPFKSPVIRQKPSEGNSGGLKAPRIVNEVLSSSGQSLDSSMRGFFEPLLGYDFGRVRVHTDSRATESAKALNALAFTVGEHVIFGEGQYRPLDISGRKLLAHELSHVVQQESVVSESPTIQRTPGNDPSAESELEAIALHDSLAVTHRIYIAGKGYDLLVNPNLNQIRIQDNTFHSNLMEHLNVYPRLKKGAYAFIFEPNSKAFCLLTGNCLGWALNKYSFVDSAGEVWSKRTEYVKSIGVEVPEGHFADGVYGEKLRAKEIPPAAIWDYYMKVEFGAVPTKSEDEAHLALFGEGFGSNSEGPRHIALRPKGGNFWLSKPSEVYKPVLHQHARQMTGGLMGKKIRLYKREGGPLDHVVIEKIPSKRETGPSEDP